MPSPLSCPLHTELELEPVFKAGLCPTPFSFPIQSSSSILRTLAPPSHLLSWTLWLPPLPASLLLAIRTPLPLLCPPPSRPHLKSLCAPDRQSLLKTPCSEPPPAQPGTASSQHILAGGRSGSGSLVKLAHDVVSMAEGAGGGELPEMAVHVPRACFFSLSLLVHSYHSPGGHGWGGRCCPRGQTAVL